MCMLNTSSRWLVEYAAYKFPIPWHSSEPCCTYVACYQHHLLTHAQRAKQHRGLPLHHVIKLCNGFQAHRLRLFVRPVAGHSGFVPRVCLERSVGTYTQCIACRSSLTTVYNCLKIEQCVPLLSTNCRHKHKGLNSLNSLCTSWESFKSPTAQLYNLLGLNNLQKREQENFDDDSYDNS